MIRFWTLNKIRKKRLKSKRLKITRKLEIIRILALHKNIRKGDTIKDYETTLAVKIILNIT